MFDDAAELLENAEVDGDGESSKDNGVGGNDAGI